MNKNKRNIFSAFIICITLVGLGITIYLTLYEKNLNIRKKADEYRTIRICNEGCDYSDINQAFANAQDNDTIFIDTIEYDGMGVLSSTASLNLPDDITNLTIQGRGNDETIWKLSTSVGGMGHQLHIESLNNVTLNITDLTFTGNIHENSSIHIYGTSPEGDSDPNPNVNCTFNFENIEVSDSLAAGLYLSGDNQFTVKNSDFSCNEWPGVSIHGNANVEIEYCEFDNHKHQGIDVKDQATTNIKESEFSSNSVEDTDKSYGAVQYYHMSSGSIENCTFSDNLGNSINLGSSTDSDAETANVTIINNTISETLNNKSAVNLFKDTTATIKNNLIINNTGEGIQSYESSSSEIINNTINNNEKAGIFLYDSSDSVIKNNIITNNQNGISAESYAGTVNISYNNVWNNLYEGNEVNYNSVNPGENDISLDPIFKSDNDFHLDMSGCGSTELPCSDSCPENCSPSIDAGDPSSEYNDVDGSRNDMGVYGGQGLTQTCSTDDDCKPSCNGKKRKGYTCESNQCTYTTELSCNTECGADCESNSDCQDNQVCNTDTCTCELASNTCAVADLWGENKRPDGIVNLYDLTRVLGNYNTSNSEVDIWGEDAAPDNKVDMLDVTKVLGCWKRVI